MLKEVLCEMDDSNVISCVLKRQMFRLENYISVRGVEEGRKRAFMWFFEYI